MFGLGIWDFTFLFFVPVAAAVGAITYFSVKAIRKKLKNRSKRSRQNRVETLSRSQERTNQRTRQRGRTARKDFADESMLAQAPGKQKKEEVVANNFFHTIGNYEAIYKNNRNFCNGEVKKKKLIKAYSEGKFNDKENPKEYVFKRINKINEMLGVKEEVIKPDYVRVINENGQEVIDRKNYIQVFDENLAEEFKMVSEQLVQEESTDKPQVMKCEVKNGTKIKNIPGNICVSSTNKDAFLFGQACCLNQLCNLAEQNALTAENFPIKVIVRSDENKQQFAYFNCVEDLQSEVDDKLSQIENNLASRQQAPSAERIQDEEELSL